MDLFKDVIPTLTIKTDNLLVTNPEFESKYEAFMVNRTFSMGIETVLFANLMNYYRNSDKRLQYDFYFYGLPNKKVWNKFTKKDKLNNIEAIAEYYDYSMQKAKEVLNILTDEQIEEIKKKVYKGEPTK